MTIEPEQLKKLRRVIQENLRIQKGAGQNLSYISVGSVMDDVCARQNHAVFARRGCGKTLLLHDSNKHVDGDVKILYLNCEDFKKHSFPNVLVEILDSLFKELEIRLTGWFGRKARSRDLIVQIRKEFSAMRVAADLHEEEVRKQTSIEGTDAVGAKVAVGPTEGTVSMSNTTKEEVERTYKAHVDKVKNLDMLLPKIKAQVREFFELSSGTKAVFLQIDDLYHLRRTDQAFVVDYIHRLCKDLPLYFKIATLRHASTLYVDRAGQPIGAQERHDYQPINIDYTFSDFRRTRDQNWKILQEFAKLAGIDPEELDSLFKGQGFDRLVMAGGGVPRDVLSLFLEVLATVQAEGDGRIGKDDVRILSKSNFERRIEELKQDSEGGEQDVLMRGIYVLREFCLTRETNVFVISERLMQQSDDLRSLVYRLLDYRIIHNIGTALTHKSEKGTYQAFAIDIGCYAHLRKLHQRFNELDIADTDLKEKTRSSPVLAQAEWTKIWEGAPADLNAALLSE